MKEIKLTKGMAALVDDEDYPALMNYTWRALKDGSNWYACMSIGSKSRQRRLMMHRILLQLTNPKDVCDHKDGNSLNNQKHNLRKCTNEQNCRNRKMKHHNRIGFKGVSYKDTHKKYQASINVNGKFIFGGHFKTPIEAAKRYNELAIVYHGDFARLNPIPNDK